MDLDDRLRRLHAESPAAAQLLGVAAFLGDALVPSWLPTASPELLPDPLRERLAGEPAAMAETVEPLEREGLASTEAGGFRLEDGVASAVRRRMSAREKGSFGRAAVGLLHRAFPERVGRDREAERAEALAPHVRAAAGHPVGGGRATSEAAHSLARLAAHLREAGRPEEACSALEQGVEVAGRGSGVEPVLRAVLLDELAGARAGLEDRDGALAAVDRALEVIPALPDGSPHRLLLLANLATTCREVGALERGGELYARALKEVEVEGARSARPVEIELLIGKADVELASGDAAAAAETAGRAVELAEEHVGQVHAFTVRALWLRGDALREIGESEPATSLYRRSLVAEGQLLGAEHPSVGQKLMAFGLHLAEIGRGADAAEHLRRAHDVFEAALGPEADPTRAAAGALEDLRAARRD